MIWKGMKNSDVRREEIKNYIINAFSKYYPRNGNNAFVLSDKTIISVFSMGGGQFDCLGINYQNNPEFGNDDGDLYYIDDYDTVEQLFADMLEETRR